MLNEEDHKRILSQLFDVKPMRNSDDLDWDNINKIKKILNLRGKATEKEMIVRREALILNRSNLKNILREKESLVFIDGDKEDLVEKTITVNNGEIDASYLLFDDYFAAAKAERGGIIDSGDIVSNNVFDDVQKRLTESSGADDSYFDFDDSEEVRHLMDNNDCPSREEALRELEEFSQPDDDFEERLLPDLSPDHCLENHVDYSEDLREWDIETGGEKYPSAPPFYVRIGLISVISAAFVFLAFSSAFYFFGYQEKINSGKFSSGIIESGIFKRNDFLGFTDEENGRSLEGFFSLLKAAGNNYLLVLQDTSETRPAGGVIRYYGILSFQNNEINFYVDNVFSIDGRLQAKIVPPRPMQKVSTVWSMHNANWSPDFSESAKKIIGFYNNVKEEKIDGVISFNPESIKNIVDLAEPIVMSGRGLIVGTENIGDVINPETKNDFNSVLKNAENIFVDFAALLLDKIKNSPAELKTEVAEIIFKELNEGNVLVFFADNSANNFAASRGWGSGMKSVEGDFLSVVSANFGGCPVDDKVGNYIKHTANINEEGFVVVELIVAKDGRNVTVECGAQSIPYYVRVYVPEGAELLSADGNAPEEYKPPLNYDDHGFQRDSSVEYIEKNIYVHSSGTEVYMENGKTVFGNWVYLPPRGSVELVYEYKLPLRLDKNGNKYHLTVQRQSGSIGDDFEGIVSISENFVVKEKSDNLREESGVYTISGNLDGDLEYGVSLTNF